MPHMRGQRTTHRSVFFFFCHMRSRIRMQVVVVGDKPLLSEWGCQCGCSFTDQFCQWSNKDKFLLLLSIWFGVFLGDGTCACVCRCMYKWVWMPVEARSEPWVSFLRNHPSCVLRQSHQIGAHQAGRAVCPASPRNPPGSAFPALDFERMLPHPAFLQRGYWGLGLRPSCLPIKDFTSQTISPSLCLFWISLWCPHLWV